MSVAFDARRERMRTARAEGSSQAGFSLLELMIAMLVTLLVSGAVFGLITAGQGAFRREPELTERQQNIRVAMDLIQRDLATAGAGMVPFIQVLTRSDNVDESQPPFLNGRGPSGPSGQASDYLQVFGNDGMCPDIAVQGTPGNNLKMSVKVPSCYGEDEFVMVIFPDPPGGADWGFAHEIRDGGQDMINFPPGLPPVPKSDLPGTPPWPNGARTVQRIQLVRYEIANGADGVPELWRSGWGGISRETNLYVPPPDPLGGWQQVARGIEDLQVRYRAAGAGAFDDMPPLMALNGWDRLVQEVEVTLWGRALAQRLQGESDTGGAVRAVRGSLRSVTTPRAVLMHLRDAPPPYTWQ